jgi:hypothetical protein
LEVNLLRVNSLESSLMHMRHTEAKSKVPDRRIRYRLWNRVKKTVA